MTSVQKLGGFLIGSIFVGAGTAVLVRPQSTSTATTPQIVIASAPVVTAPPADTREVHASDGTMNLTLVKSGAEESLFISDIAGGNKHQIFQKTYSYGGITLPANSWSPDNKYVFVEEQEGGVTTFLVMKASGEPFADGKSTIDVGALFTEKLKELKLTTITGWAAPTLLFVTTTKDGTKSATYWFDVDYRNFLLLRD